MCYYRNCSLFYLLHLILYTIRFLLLYFYYEVCLRIIRYIDLFYLFKLFIPVIFFVSCVVSYFFHIIFFHISLIVSWGFFLCFYYYFCGSITKIEEVLIIFERFIILNRKSYFLFFWDIFPFLLFLELNVVSNFFSLINFFLLLMILYYCRYRDRQSWIFLPRSMNLFPRFLDFYLQGHILNLIFEFLFLY